MNFQNIIKMYSNALPLVVKFTSSCGLFTGIYANLLDADKNKENNHVYESKNVYANLIGYTTVGMLTGLTYPISVPIISYYTYKSI